MIFFVLGGEGFIGSAICRYLKKNKIKYFSITKKNYRKFLYKNCDIFVNCNGNSIKWFSEKDYSMDFDKTVISTFKSTKDFKFKKNVLISSGEVYNKNIKIKHENSKIESSKLSNYGFNKLLAEEIIKRTCNSFLIFRMGGFVGKNLKKNLVYDLINNKQIWVSKKSTYQYIDVDEASSIIFKILKKTKNEIFNLTGKGPINLVDILSLLNIKRTNFKKKLKLEKNNLHLKKISKLTKIPTTKNQLKIFYDNFKNTN